MGLERRKRSLKIRLLALVLALALAWFVINPAPGPVRRERKADPPDAGKRRLQAEAEAAPLSSSAYPSRQHVATFTVPLEAQRDEPFDWPTFIELD